LNYLSKPNYLFITLVINTHTKVASKANRKLRAICTSSMFIALASTLSETAKETIKTISGSKKARTALSATDGHEAFPNCS